MKRVTSLFALLIIAAMLLSACGGESTATPLPAPTNTTAAAAAATSTTAPAAATNTTAPAAATATTGSTTSGSATGKIAILLPETKTARYESQDLPDFKAKL